MQKDVCAGRRAGRDHIRKMHLDLSSPSSSTSHATTVRARGEERLADALVVRVFDADARAAITEHAHREIERLLRAADDDDVVRFGYDATLFAQMFGEHAAQ